MNKKILIADDETSILEIADVVLTESGYIVICVSQSEEVMNKVKEECPDLIFLDLWMPGISGETLTRMIKSSPDTKDIPVVVFSASRETIDIAKKTNADGYLLKPFDIEDMIQMAAKCLANA